jgi:hypothetical protein
VIKIPSLTSRSYVLLHRTGLFQLLAAAVLTIFLCAISHAIEMKGMNYIAWDANGLLTADSDMSLTNARKIGCNWIGLNVTWYQDDVNSTLIEPDPCSSSTTESVIHAIDKCHELGMKVMLKPMVDCRDTTWRKAAMWNFFVQVASMQMPPGNCGLPHGKT